MPFDSRIVIRDATLADADALDTALMVMGTEKGTFFANELVSHLCLYQDGQRLQGPL